MFVCATQEFVERYGLLPDGGGRVLAAVSGGADSVAMLLALAELRTEICVCHVHHHLRGPESDADEAFVRALAERLGLPVDVRHVDVRGRVQRTGESVEMVARALRHEALQSAAKVHSRSAVALAHTRDDRDETLLLNLVRGTGVRGLAAMGPKGDHGIIRPILWARRSEVLQSLRDRGERYREDSTNAELRALRNRIRHEVMPALAAVGAAAGLSRAQEVASLDAAALDYFADAWLRDCEETEEGLSITTSHLARIPDGALHALVRRATERVGGTLYGLSFGQVEEVVRLVRGGHVHAEVSLPLGVAWRIERDSILVVRADEAPAPPPAPWQPTPLVVPGMTRVEAIGFVVRAEPAWAPVPRPRDRSYLRVALDADRCGEELLLRPFRPGDRIAPLGMGGRRRKLKALFSEKRVPLDSRRVYPLLVNVGDEALWVPGLAMAEKVRITAETQRVIVLCCAALGCAVADWG